MSPRRKKIVDGVPLSDFLVKTPYGNIIAAKEAASKGRTLGEISQAGGWETLIQARTFLIQFGLHDGWKIERYARNELADRLALLGRSLKQIAAIVPEFKDKRWAYEYLRRTGLLELQRERRRNSNFDHIISDLSALIQCPVSNVASAIQAPGSTLVNLILGAGYRNSTKAERSAFYICTELPMYWGQLENVLEAFQRYYNALENGEKKSVKECTSGLGFPHMAFHRWLRFLKLEPLYSSHRRTTPEEKEAIIRAWPLDFTTYDIANYLGMKLCTVDLHLSKIQSRERRDISYLGPIKSNWLASLIYDAHDAGMDPNVFSEMFDIDGKKIRLTEDKIRYARENRKTIEPRIIYALQAMFANPDIDKPYKIT